MPENPAPVCRRPGSGSNRPGTPGVTITSGATEVGAWGYECQAQAGVHLNEGEFICEVVDPVTGDPAEEGELVMTNLGRVRHAGYPVSHRRSGEAAEGTL